MTELINKVPPVSEGDVVSVVPFTFGSEGDAIAKFAGFTVIIKDPVFLGFRVSVRVGRVFERFCLACVVNDEKDKEGDEDE